MGPNTTPQPAFPGSPYPLGVSPTDRGLNFAVFTDASEPLEVLLYGEKNELLGTYVLSCPDHQTGRIRHGALPRPPGAVSYGYRIRKTAGNDGEVQQAPVLLDPYARWIAGGEVWGQAARRTSGLPTESPETFEWGPASPPARPLSETVIYEVGVREYTAHPSSGVEHPGTFAGLVEKIPHLTDLGITAVELLPVFEWDEMELRNRDPETGATLRNLWGYSPLSFFAPKASLASSSKLGGQIREFKELVRACHQAGIEVILDVVFNHTGEGGIDGPTSSFRGLAPDTYYMGEESGHLLDFTGCGNTINANHPVVTDLIVESLRSWAIEMRVDGFRFDLAAALTRDSAGQAMDRPPLLDRISRDPVLSHKKLIAEAWDAGGLYLVGSFPGEGWRELNGKYRDDVRRFMRGDSGTNAALATRIAGSSDLYHGDPLGPARSINFVTCHDGFTLADLVAYHHKHNLRNGEENRDGLGDNLAWNSGAEGPTDDAKILRLRTRRQKNFLCLLFLSQGIPLLHAGDEFGRTKKGNNNTYCQDNETGWVDWRAFDQNWDLYRFCRELIRFRRRHPILGQRDFLTGDKQRAKDELPDVAWLGLEGKPVDWEAGPSALGLFLHHREGLPSSEEHPEEDLVVLLNASALLVSFQIPNSDRAPWRIAIDTSLLSPHDLRAPGEEEPLSVPDSYDLPGHTIVVLVRQPEG